MNAIDKTLAEIDFQHEIILSPAISSHQLACAMRNMAGGLAQLGHLVSGRRDEPDSARSATGALRNWLVSKDHLPYAFWLGKDGHA